jgi:autotransporter-associated beta strand protein
LTKDTNTSTLTLSGSNSYGGLTTVSKGTLLFDGNSSGATGTATVASGATIGGTGSYGGALNVSGTLSPGDSSIESLKTGALTMASGSTFRLEVGTSSAQGADLLAANGALSLTSVTLDLTGATTGLSSASWNPGDKITLISYTGTAITSGFTNFANGGIYTYGSNQWLFNYNDTVKGSNFAPDATGTSFITMTVVPEPGTAVALLGGTTMLLGLRRRRSKA